MGAKFRPGRPREVAPGIFRLSAASASGMVVHLYLLRSPDCQVLVDTGWTYTTESVDERLATLGTRIEDIDAVLVTHSHEDHLGGAASWHDRIRGPVHGWESTTPLFSNFYDYYDRRDHWDRWFDSVLPEGPLREQVLQGRASAPTRALVQGGDGTIPTASPVAFGQVLDLGPWRFELLDGRGHDPFHGGWLEHSTSSLFSGDVLLRVPTPIMPAMNDEIGLYRRTLRQWRASLAPALLLPGHGAPETDFPAAIDRSEAWLKEAWQVIENGLKPHRPFDAAREALKLASREPEQLRRRIFTWLTNLDAQLVELEALEFVRRTPERTWVLLRPLPSYSSLPG